MIAKPFLLFLILCASAFGIAEAAPADDPPQVTLQKTISEVLGILHEGNGLSLEEKRTAVLDLLESNFSFDIIIRRALGRNWSRLDEQQQTKITQLITDLLIRAYTRELKNGPKPNIIYSKPVDLSDNKIQIDTKVSYKDTMVTVSYRLANVKGRGWQVYDVLIESVSMVTNYRKQFDEHFQTKSAADLITLLQDKLDNIDA